MNKEINISENNFFDWEELWDKWYTCPNCDNIYGISRGTNYCPDCGIKLNWTDKDPSKEDY